MRCSHCASEQNSSAGVCTVCGRALMPSASAAVTGVVSAGVGEAETRVSGTGRAAARTAALTVGQTFASRYHIIRQLGSGGMGVVYQAFDAELGVAVALKVIRPEVLADPAEAAQIERRFKRELVLARQVTHRNVVRIHDLGDADGVKYLTMPLVEGEDLAAVLKRRGKLPVSEVIAIGRQIAQGLSAAHQVGVVHRDLKPENVMIASDGSALIMDFGIARSMGTTATATAMGAVLGTLEYMAPEQAQGFTVDQRADVYACGLILYDMLTGRQRLARSENAMSEMLSRMQQAPPSLRTLDPDLPEPLERIVSRTLEPAPEARFQTSAELAAAFDALTPDGHALTRPKGTPARSLFAPVAAVIAVAALAIAGWLAWHGRTAVPAAPITPISVVIADFDNKSGDPLLDGLVEQALGIGIEGASFVSAYPRREAARLAAQIKPGAGLTEESARLLAIQQGIARVVAGSIAAPSPPSYRLDVRVVDPTDGRELMHWNTDASGKDDVLNAVGRAAARIRSALGDRKADPERIAAGETFTAASLEAAHAYVQAQELQSAGKYEDALKRYAEAVARDPNFGRAYAGLGAASSSLGRRQDAERYYKRAVELIDRMTPRERYRTRGGYFLLEHNAGAAREEFEKLVNEYPADSSGRANLAYAYFLQRDMKRAVEICRQASELDPKNVLRMNNVALYSLYAGDFAGAEKQAGRVLAINPDFAKARLAAGLAQVATGRTREAEGSYKTLASARAGARADFGALGLADLALYEGRTADAAAIAEQGAAATQSAATAGRLLEIKAEALALEHQPAEARLAADAAGRSDDPGLAMLGGRVLASVGRAPAAEAIAEKLERAIDAEPRLDGALLRGEIALQKEDARGAIDAFDAASKIAPTWLGHFGRGRAYVLAGKFTEASSEFEWCQQHSGEAAALLLDDVPTWRFMAALQYYVGRTQEGLHSPAAAATYRAFLAIKQQGDQQGLVADARRRLESLDRSR